MVKLLKELAVMGGGVALGTVLLLITGFYVRYKGFLSVSWGYPVAWHYTADLMIGGVSVFGVYLGRVIWLNLGEDLVFWLGLSLIVVECSSHFAVPYIRRKLDVRRTRKNMASIRRNVIQTPDRPTV
jgi:hypothetical protein